MEYKINGSFICDRCRNICDGTCHEKLSELLNGNLTHYEENKDLIGRKQIIHCLGKYCDTPCKYQRKDFTPYNEGDGIKPLIDLIQWMGSKLNNILTKE